MSIPQFDGAYIVSEDMACAPRTAAALIQDLTQKARDETNSSRAIR